MNLDKILEKQRGEARAKRLNRIYMVGVELEGGWIKQPPGWVRDGSVVGLDGGRPQQRRAAGQLPNFRTVIGPDGRLQVVRVPAPPPVVAEPTPTGPAEYTGPLVAGELPSDPLPPEAWPIWVKQWYPNKVNDTCGLHVHVSFKDVGDYGRLMDDKEFLVTTIEYMKRWAEAEKLPKKHPLWARLNGNSEFCQHQWWPDAQVAAREKRYDKTEKGHRYTVWNFCWNRNATAECRLLPMMETAEQSISAVQTILDVTNAYLVATFRERKASKDVDILDDLKPLISEKKTDLFPVRKRREYR